MSTEPTDLWRCGALELARRIASREVTSREVVEAHLERIGEINPVVNAVTRVQAETALAQADAADHEVAAGPPRGPLHGVPFSTKENIDCLGVPTTEGLVAFADASPSADAPTVERLKAAGAIPLARTNMPEVGLRVHTDNELHGLTVNPWDPERTCGGSSGGEGAAIATGMTPMGLGNDIGGSVRNPAYCCGIVAHKPTPHRLPRASSIGPTSQPPTRQLMSVEGPMARGVADLRAMFEVMHGRHWRDPWSVSTPFSPRGETEPRPGVAVVAEPAGGETDPEIAAGVRRVADVLADAGYRVQEVDPPDIAAAAEAWAWWLGSDIDARRDQLDLVLGADARRFLDLTSGLMGPVDLASTITAMTQRHALATAWVEFMQTHPIVLGPMWTQLPFTLGTDVSGVAGAESVLSGLRLVVAANLLGLPATAVPIGVGARGLPLGVQVIGEHHRDDLCLDVAADIEAHFEVITPIDPTRPA